MQKRINFVKLEKLAFFLIVIINLFPVLFTQFVPTLDGPAHLYNSTLINNMLFGSSELLGKFYAFTPDPVPNWSGHFLLSAFNLFLPGYIAEKIFVIAYTTGLPIAFRYLIKSINPDNYFFCYLIFPFVFSFPYFLGFYNFCAGLVFLFLTLGFWIRGFDKELKKKQILLLFLLFTLTYFSHVFVFAMLLFIIGIHLFVGIFRQLLLQEDKRTLFKEARQKIGILIVAAFPAVALTIYYFYKHSATHNYTYVETAELIEWLKNIRPAIVFNIIDEEAYTIKINYVLGLLCLIAFCSRIAAVWKRKRLTGVKSVLRVIPDPTDGWFISAILFLLLYFKLPDADGSAGYVSIRLALLFYLFMIVWICSQKLPLWLLIITIPIVLFYNFERCSFYKDQVEKMDEIVQECYEMAEFIEPNSVVLPLSFSDEWMYGHFSNYLGSDKPMVILENYESGTGYFPLRWNEEEIPNTYIGENPDEMENCVNWRINVQHEAIPVKYIFILGNIESKTDDCNKKIVDIIKKHYTEIHASMECRLYERK